MIKAHRPAQKLLLKGAALLSSLWLTTGCAYVDPMHKTAQDQKERQNKSNMISALSFLAVNANNFSSGTIFDCSTNPYNKNISTGAPYSKGGRNNPLFPVNCTTPGSPVTTTPVASWVGPTSGSVNGLVITTDINDSSETGYAKLTFSPALATSAHNKALGIQITGNSSTAMQQAGKGFHSLILIEVYGDPLTAPVNRFYIYQPSDQLVTDMKDNQYLSPVINIPALTGADLQEIRFYGTGTGQKIIVNFVKLGSL